MAAYRIVNTTILSDPNYTTSQDVTTLFPWTGLPAETW
jgi:hypothetical protein